MITPKVFQWLLGAGHGRFPDTTIGNSYRIRAGEALVVILR